MHFRTRPYRRPRSQIDPFRRPLGTPANATLTHAGATLTLDFDNPVQLSAAILPITVGVLQVVKAVQVTPTRVEVTYSAPIAAGMAWEIPARMTELRTPTGGYVAASAGTF
jgi:hypothetical protein